jgi:hypothetical protein
MSRSFKIIIVLLIVILGAGFYLAAPGMFAAAVPDYLNKNIGSFLVVDHSDFSRSPPELVLTGIHLKNPGEFGDGDAVTIGQANIVFNNYSHNPYSIKSITLQNIHGKQIVKGDTDNLTAVHSLLMDRKYQTPHGLMASPVVLGTFATHNASVTNEQGTIITPLKDKNLTPVGAMADNPPLQNVIVDVLGTIVEQQQAGTDSLAMKSMADKATETIKEIGSSMKSFFSGP